MRNVKVLVGRPLPSASIVATDRLFRVDQADLRLASAAARLPIELTDCCMVIQL